MYKAGRSQLLLTELPCNVCKDIKPKTSEFFQLRRTQPLQTGEILFDRTCKKCKVKATDRRRHASLFNHIKTLYQYAKYRAKIQQIPFTIPPKYLHQLFEIQEGKCALTGVPLERKAYDKGINITNISVDKIDPSLGYVEGNIQLVCYWVNVAKFNLATEEFKKWCGYVVSHVTK